MVALCAVMRLAAHASQHEEVRPGWRWEGVGLNLSGRSCLPRPAASLAHAATLGAFWLTHPSLASPRWLIFHDLPGPTHLSVAAVCLLGRFIW
jgi:hypothetical protein